MAYVETANYRDASAMLAGYAAARARLWKPRKAVLDTPIQLKASQHTPVPSLDYDLKSPIRTKKKGADKASAEREAFEYVTRRCIELHLPIGCIMGIARSAEMQRSKSALLVETYVKFDTLSLESIASIFKVRPQTASKKIRGLGQDVRHHPVSTAQYKTYQEFIPTGHKGIQQNVVSKKYRARLAVSELTLNCGVFNTLEEAIAARHAKMIECGRTPN